LKRGIDRAPGFAYIEVLIAVLLLALCALPAANAVRNGLNAADAAPARAKALRCMRDKMESVLAEPYENLLAAQNGNQPTTKYSEGADNDCAERSVYIDVYLRSDTSDTGNSTALLRVDVISPPPPQTNKVIPAETGYPFTALVSP
jgi:Tfp pilus assembly protein PilV